MYFRCALIFCAVAVVLAQGDSDELKDEGRSFLSNELLKIAKDLLEKEIGAGPANCIEQAVETCKHEIKHLQKFLDCGKDFFKENNGICLVD